MRTVGLLILLAGFWSYAWCPDPEFCGRDCWDPDGTHQPQAEASPTQPTHIVVHHSGDGTVFPGGTDFQSIVRLYWSLHVETNGWDDIGYNWLIDRNGVIYQGRPRGGQGAHFSCMNGETIGICLIGDFRYEEPTEQALNALAHLVAWEAEDWQIDPLQLTYHNSSQLDLYGLCCHRDGNASTAPGSCVSGTICPGPNLYAQMDALRDRSGHYCDGSTPFIYPNPTVGMCYVQGDVERLEVIASNGTLVLQGSGLTEIDLSGEARGLYFVRMYLPDGQVVVQRLVKQ